MRWTAAWPLAFVLAACSESPLPSQPSPGPPPFLTFAGVIAESGTNAPLAEVAICFTHANCALTAGDGSYRFTVDPASLPFSIGSNVTLCPFAFRDGYEQRGACVPIVNHRVSWSTTLQRLITLSAGEAVRTTIFKGEGNGVVDSGLCESCKSFNVSVPGSGTLVLGVVADSPQSNLRVEVFYEGFENGALRITDQRTVQVVVHAALVPASFELVTSFTRGS